ncbi:Acg family FMN-binding oxidoreductase [Kribbella sp. NBC_00889]|uniref:Acg family FMN-binding oxidoreductase n=1 Tax=Kribbella sp. NBC_00889 TaxID=2975974 RepID=UPI0038686215|nr:nitroreductase family protein [Kribbella sp. NBC_00889]
MSKTSVLTDDEIGILLTAAVHAPSMHNTQPWRFEVHGPVVDVLLDRKRLLPSEDPAGRANRIGIGAAVLNLRVAAAMLGRESRIVPDPDPNCPEVMARVFVADRRTPVPGLGSLYGELRARRTYRGPLLDQPIPPRVTGRLDEAAQAERATLRWLDADATSRLGELLRRVDEHDLHDEDRLHERLRWIGGDRSGDGIQESALGPLPTGPAFVRDLSAGSDSSHRSQAVFEDSPAIAVLCTPQEDAAAWLRAGMALERALLVATSYDLAASFLNQVLEHSPSRAAVRELVGGRCWPQMVIRLGYPAQPAHGTARRDWRDSFDRWF